MNDKMDAYFLLVVISVAIGAIALICYNPFKMVIDTLDTMELTVTQMEFTTLNDSDIIILHVTNSGTLPVTVDAVKIKDETRNKITVDSIHGPTFKAGGSGTITVDYDWITGTKYSVIGFTSDGVMVMSYTARA